MLSIFSALKFVFVFVIVAVVPAAAVSLLSSLSFVHLFDESVLIYLFTL